MDEDETEWRTVKKHSVILQSSKPATELIFSVATEAKKKKEKRGLVSLRETIKKNSGDPQAQTLKTFTQPDWEEEG